MLHVHIIQNGTITQLPSLRPGDPPASITDDTAIGPLIVCLSCRDDDQGATVWVSIAGVHLTVGHTWQPISDHEVIERAIGPGETYERPLSTRWGPATLRLTHEGGHP